MTPFKNHQIRLLSWTLLFTGLFVFRLSAADDFGVFFDDSVFEDPTAAAGSSSVTPAAPQTQPAPQAQPAPQTQPAPQAQQVPQPQPAPQTDVLQVETIPAEAVQQAEHPQANPSGAPAEQPSTEPADASEEKEISLIHDLLSLPESTQKELKGKPTSLSEVLAKTNNPEKRRQLTESYWELTEKLALYHLSLIYSNDIEDCIARYAKEGNLSQSETAVLLSARRRGEQRVNEAKLSFTEVQFRFADLYADLTNQSSQDGIQLAIPTEIPTTVSYKTRFDKIKEEKKLPAETAFINEAIPTRFEVVKEYDQAAAAAFESYKTLYFAAGTSAELLLSAADRLTAAKESLVRSVTAYNCLIAAYVSETVGSEVRGTQLLTTMVRLPESSKPAANKQTAASQIPEFFAQNNPVPTSAEIPNTNSAQGTQQIIRPK